MDDEAIGEHNEMGAEGCAATTERFPPGREIMLWSRGQALWLGCEV